MGGWDLDAPQTEAQRIASVNGVRLVQRAVELIRAAIDHPPLTIIPALICELHGLARHRLIDGAGVLRVDDVRIRGSRHAPPPSAEVGRLVEELCAYCNRTEGDAIHHAAYALWRLNWIHPFAPDGNGRTARAVALIVLHARLGVVPGAGSGKPTFLEYLSWKRLDYHDALEAADAADRAHAVDLGLLEALLERAIEAST